MVQPNEFGEDGPTVGAMMNMNVLFGNPAFDKKTHDVCEILEIIAPNVSELQLFRDETTELCMGRECLFIFPVVSNSHAPSFTFSPFVTPFPVLSPIHSSPPGSLDRRYRVLAVLPVAISDLN